MYKLLIHDMNEEAFEKVKDKYASWKIISDDGTIHPCIGCFTCWRKTPGKCVFKDGYDQMAALIDGAEEVVYNSRFTFGGFSSFIKNVFDRSIGYVLPYFEVSENEMHHKRRYSDIKKITFVFRGENLSESEKQMARDYVAAVCRNMRNEVKEVIFEEEKNENREIVADIDPIENKTILLNCSLRGVNANSEKFLKRVEKQLENSEYYRLCEYQDDTDQVIRKLMEAETIVLAMPLYVDGLSSTVIRLLNRMENYGSGKGRKIYVLANLGLYESHQLKNLLAMVRYWCDRNDYDYCGSIAIGAGELVGTLIDDLSFGPVGPTIRGLKKFADHIRSNERFEDLYVQPSLFPRWLYIMVANRSWDLHALKDGLKPADLLAKPEAVE